MTDLILSLDVMDRIPREGVDPLVAALDLLDAEPEVEGEETDGMLSAATVIMAIKIGVPTAAAIAVIVSYLYKAFHCGVLMDLSGDKPVISKNPDLPRGSVLIIRRDGTQEIRESLSVDQIAALLKGLLSFGDAEASAAPA